MTKRLEKSDLPIVPTNLANNASVFAAELVEGRGRTKRNAVLQSRDLTQSRATLSQAQHRIGEAAKRNKQAKLTALFHHLTVDCLRVAFFSLKKSAAAGSDGLRWQTYAEDLEPRLQDLHSRLMCGAYRARPSRRVMIPKADGRKRPLGIAGLEDKIVQAAVVSILTPVYEAMFLGFSYGFRPGRSQHDALDALAFGINRRKVNWILDADIRTFFDTINHDWLVTFVEHRVADKRIVRLIRKWLKAGVLEEDRLVETEEGTPQGAVISPLLANIYLHYVYDLWAQAWRSRHADGQVIIVRYADDTVVGFQYRRDAERFLGALNARLATFSLPLHSAKTRLIEFGRYALANRQGRGQGKPETFDFLGFTHYCTTKRNSEDFQLGRKTMRKRLRAKLKEIGEALKRHRHKPLCEQGQWVGRVVQGYFQYHAVPTNTHVLFGFRKRVGDLWLKALRRRSQRDRFAWKRLQMLMDRYLPAVRILHPWPDARFRLKHSR